MVGLGKMGMNLTLNLLTHGYEVVAYDLHPEVVTEAESRGALGVRARRTGRFAGETKNCLAYGSSQLCRRCAGRLKASSGGGRYRYRSRQFPLQGFVARYNTPPAEEAMELQTAAPVITLSLLMRYRSLNEDTFAGKVVAALRGEFGGHAVDKSS